MDPAWKTDMSPAKLSLEASLSASTTTYTEPAFILSFTPATPQSATLQAMHRAVSLTKVLGL